MKKGKTLYSFNWCGGGYNSVWADKKSDIPQAIAAQIGKNLTLKVDERTIKAHRTPAQIDAYHKSLPYWD